MMPRDGLLVYIAIAFVAFLCDARTEEWSPLSTSSNGNNITSVMLDDLPLISDYHDTFLEEFRWLIESGKLSLARRKALEELRNLAPTRCKMNDIAKVYVDTFQKSYDQVGNDYLQKIRKSIHTKNLQILHAKKDNPNCTKTHSDWSIVDPNELWDKSCSILPAEKTTTKIHSVKEFPLSSSSSRQDPFFESFSQARPSCCEFTPGSWTYLRLPVIQEPAIRLRIPYHTNNSLKKQSTGIDDSVMFLDLEQDGYLRPFDVAGILWPTGYLLSLCLGDIIGCPIPELHVLITQYQQNFFSEGASSTDGKNNNHFPLALELGAGIGASSIALAKAMLRMGFPFLSSHHPKNQPWVVATDVAPHALALTMANANSHHVDIGTALMDYFNQTSVQDVKKKFFPPAIKNIVETDLSSDGQKQAQPQHVGFALVFGSSLQRLFQDTDRPESVLWRTLDELLDLNNPNSLAILVHHRADPLTLPPDINFPYRLVRRLSASDEVFGNMKTRDGDASDFEICVFQPHAAHRRETKSSSMTTKTSNIEL